MKNEMLDSYFREEYNNLCKRMKNRVGEMGCEDVVQEAFCRACKYWDSFNPEVSQLEQWFEAILFNAMRAYQNEERLLGMSRPVEEYDLISEDDESIIEEIMLSISTKPEHEKKILILHYKNRYRPIEISQVLNLSLRTVKNRLYEFRKEFAASYSI